MTRPPLANVRPVLEEPWRSLSWVNPLESRYERMRQFRPLHFSMLVVSIITTGIFIMAAKHYERLGTLKKARVVSGWVLGVLGALWGLVSLDPKQRDVRETLPLHMCDVLRPIMSLALITGHPFALQLSTYWGIVFNPQAMLSPDLPYYFEPKWLRFSTYWFFHIVALAIPVALLATGMKLTWKGFSRHRRHDPGVGRGHHRAQPAVWQQLRVYRRAPQRPFAAEHPRAVAALSAARRYRRHVPFRAVDRRV